MERHPDPIPLLAGQRNRYQLVWLCLTLAVGLQFYLFVEQAGSGGPPTIPRPAGVEGFLPIGALLGWKQLMTTGVWDPVHPAAMVILLYAGAISLLLRKSFCSWFCPVGTVSEWLWKLGHRLLGRNIRLPAALDWPLRSLKYILLGFFVTVTLRMPSADIAAFLNSPYYQLADVKMLHFFTRIGIVAATVVAMLILFSVLVRNFWCRYLCPYGALMGMFGRFSPTAVRRDATACTTCLRCSRACPSHLPVHRQVRVSSPECSGCLDCVQVCPSAGALSMTTYLADGYAWSATRLGLAVAAAFVALVAAARFTGHWESAIGPGEFSMLLHMIDSPMLTHPTF